MKTSARVQTCGKLYLAGEYAVLTAGQPAIIKAIPIYMTGEIQTAPDYHLTSDMFEQIFPYKIISFPLFTVISLLSEIKFIH